MLKSGSCCGGGWPEDVMRPLARIRSPAQWRTASTYSVRLIVMAGTSGVAGSRPAVRGEAKQGLSSRPGIDGGTAAEGRPDSGGGGHALAVVSQPALSTSCTCRRP
jgi:hypothetical protein